jgi:hypothetical protein
MREDIHIMFSGSEKYNTDDLCDIIEDVSPKYFFLGTLGKGFGNL